jgi:hypothetical protein
VRVLLAAALATAGCGLTGLTPTSSAWAFNDSTNHYVIRTSDADTWDLPPHAGGFLFSGGGLTMEVLDADNCIVVASEELKRDVLVSVDRQGRVDFLTQHEPPRMDDLARTNTCQAPPTGDDQTS